VLPAGWLSRPAAPANYRGEIPGDWPEEQKRELLAGYKVAVCRENSYEPYYFTEKFVEAVCAGCVPVYRAHPTSPREFCAARYGWIPPTLDMIGRPRSKPRSPRMRKLSGSTMNNGCAHLQSRKHTCPPSLLASGACWLETELELRMKLCLSRRLTDGSEDHESLTTDDSDVTDQYPCNPRNPWSRRQRGDVPTRFQPLPCDYN